MPSNEIEKISPQGVDQALENMSGWSAIKNHDAIHKSFKFKDFNEAWSFMNHVAAIAENMDHHPEWSNVYNKVEITLTTHDAGGISQKDIDMAKEIDDH